MSNHEYMEDKDFNAFRKSFEKQRDIEFDERHWDALNQRLDAADRRKRRPVLGWWALAAAAMGALLLGNLFLFGSLRENQRSTAQLQQHVKQFSEQLATSQTDTVFIENTVYVYDTIFNEKTIYRTVKSVPEAYELLMAVLSADEMRSLAEGKLPERLRSFPTLEEAIGQQAVAPNEKGNPGIPAEEAPMVDLNYALELLETADIGPLQPMWEKHILWGDYLTNMELEKKKTPLMLKVRRAMTPDGLAIGLTGGPLFPFSKKLHETKGSSFGLAAEVVFSEHLRLRGDASYVRIAYSSEAMNADLGVPVIPAPGDDFVFKKAAVAQNALLFNIGMKYLMNTKGKWQPFVYAGYGVSAILPYNLYYDFEDSVLGTKVQVEQESEATYFNNGFGMASLGLSYALNDKLSFQLDGFYRSQLNKSSLSNTDLAGLRATALYQY